jgi:hypothetical protein
MPTKQTETAISYRVLVGGASLDWGALTRDILDSLRRACNGRPTAVPLTLSKIRQHGLHVAAKPFGVCLASRSDFRKHRIEFHRQPPMSSSGVHITGI